MSLVAYSVDWGKGQVVSIVLSDSGDVIFQVKILRKSGTMNIVSK